MDDERRRILLSKEELTVAEVQELWNVSPQTIVRCIQENRLEGYNAAPSGLKRAKWRIKTASLKELIGI